jgi:hypothetical protein
MTMLNHVISSYNCEERWSSLLRERANPILRKNDRDADLPNFHFHAVTAYDILRSRGVPLSKRDYEGQLRTNSLGED